MVICRNDPQPGDFGAGSLLYKGHMIQMLVKSGASEYIGNILYQINVWLICIELSIQPNKASQDSSFEHFSDRCRVLF